MLASNSYHSLRAARFIHAVLGAGIVIALAGHPGCRREQTRGIEQTGGIKAPPNGSPGVSQAARLRERAVDRSQSTPKGAATDKAAAAERELRQRLRLCENLLPRERLEALFRVEQLVPTHRVRGPDTLAVCGYKAQRVYGDPPRGLRIDLQLSVTVDCRGAERVETLRERARETPGARPSSYRPLRQGRGGAAIAGRFTRVGQAIPYHDFHVAHGSLPCTISARTSIADLDKTDELVRIVLGGLSEKNRPRPAT
ncbi:MAG: hypothetical protein MJD61_06430 [Proteobacteria bacterium]|nr:hypothetical protein [Pseudomonadota bacterium]